MPYERVNNLQPRRLTMRYGMRLVEDSRGQRIVIASKRNNWRPTGEEPEVPWPLRHVADELGLTKVGATQTIDGRHSSFALLLGVLRGEHPHEVAMGRVVKDIVLKSTPHIIAGCKRLRRRGFKCHPRTMAAETAKVWKRMFEHAM